MENHFKWNLANLQVLKISSADILVILWLGDIINAFEVMGTGGLSLGVGPLCGENSGQHLYLPVQGARFFTIIRNINSTIFLIKFHLLRITTLSVKYLMFHPMVHKYFMPRGGPPYAPQTFDVRGGPASLRIHTQARGAEFTQGYKWNIRVTQV